MVVYQIELRDNQFTIFEVTDSLTTNFNFVISLSDGSLSCRVPVEFKDEALSMAHALRTGIELIRGYQVKLNSVPARKIASETIPMESYSKWQILVNTIKMSDCNVVIEEI